MKLKLVVLLGLCSTQGVSCAHAVRPAAPKMCATTYIRVDIGERRVRQSSGTVMIEYPGAVRETLPGVTVFLKRAGKVFASVSDEEGRFTIDAPAGTYALETCREGLKTLTGTVLVNPKADLRDLELVTQTSN